VRGGSRFAAAARQRENALQVSAHILPRRVVLWLLTLMALGLRLWGLDWGPAEAGALHPGEWAWRIIERLSWSQPTYPGLWTQAFFSLAALLHGALGALAGGWQVLVGEVHTAAQVEVSARLAGRLAVALLGSGQVLLVYLVGRRYFDSVATGLVAAAVVAANPLMMTHGHYLSLDVPLGFAVLATLWAAWWLASYPRAAVAAAAGLFLGLAVTTRASGALMLAPLAAAYLLGVRRARPAASRSLVLWPAAFVAGTALGLILGYPGFVLESHQTGDLVTASFSPPPWPGEGWGEFAAGRLWRALGVIGRGVGPALMLLWVVGLGLVIWRRRWERLLPGLSPLLFLAAGVTVLRGSLEGLTAAWLPVLAPLAVWPLVWACRRLPRYRWAVAGVTMLGVALCAWPMWRSLGAGYLFWQEDTLTSTGHWLEANLPAQARVWTGPGIPLNALPGGRGWEAMPPRDQLQSLEDYVAVSSLGQAHQADPWQDWAPPEPSSRLAEVRERMFRLAVFDLKAGWPAGGGQFPRWVSPKVELYAPVEPRRIRERLALVRPPAGTGRPHALVYTPAADYGRDQAGMAMLRDGERHRVLFSPRSLEELGLVLSNPGQDLAVAEVSQGWLPSRRVSLYPGQVVDLRLEARLWPPVNSACYPVRVRLVRGQKLAARLLWDPLLLGRRALEQDRPEEAARLLGREVEQGRGGFEARVMLAEALVRLERFPEAADALAGVPSEVARAYRELATAAQTDSAWRERFSRLTGYHYGLLRQSLSLVCPLRGPPCLDASQPAPLSGRGFHAAFLPAEGPAGQLRLWLDEPFPPGQFRAELEFADQGGGPAGERVRLEVWAHGPEGSRVLSSRVLQGGETGRRPVVLPVPVKTENTRLEIRLVYLAPPRPRVERVVVGVDLREHLRHVLRWALDARGRVALNDKRYPQAVEAFQELLALDPGYGRAYLPSARALLDVGKMDRALQRVRSAEQQFANRPERLARVRELYLSMQRTEAAQRVEERLAYLRPSLKKEARFAGGLALLGYDISANQVAPGGSLDVSYYWRCWARPPLDYYIFVHLVGPERTLTYDHLLDHGRVSMTSLREGEVVREDYSMQIPPDLEPGNYRLVVGLWDPQHTGKGVPLVGGGDRVELTTIEVLPRAGGAD
jgi:tetratricopeptide (TPR) repeat protein/4-amino-4-deoxy-L-arabinose transferase-like glycosyltransferase